MPTPARIHDAPLIIDPNLPNPITMNRTSPLEDVYRVPQVATYLGVDRNTVYKLVARGELRSIKVGRHIRIPASALVEFLRGDAA